MKSKTSKDKKDHTHQITFKLKREKDMLNPKTYYLIIHASPSLFIYQPF